MDNAITVAISSSKSIFCDARRAEGLVHDRSTKRAGTFPFDQVNWCSGSTNYRCRRARVMSENNFLSKGDHGKFIGKVFFLLLHSRSSSTHVVDL